jgi:hypothetical protein
MVNEHQFAGANRRWRGQFRHRRSSMQIGGSDGAFTPMECSKREKVQWAIRENGLNWFFVIMLSRANASGAESDGAECGTTKMLCGGEGLACCQPGRARCVNCKALTP